MPAARHPRRSRLGFAAPAWQRAAWAGAYALVAFGVVAWLERPPDAAVRVPGEAVAAQPAPTSALRLVLQSTSEVGRWMVRLDGREVTALEAGPLVWRGGASIEATASHELFIEVELADPAPDHPAAVRLAIEGTRAPIERVWWIEDGALIERLVVPAGGDAP